MPEPLSLSYYYHERTKYDPETLAKKGKSLDWSQQPIPFKDYKVGTTYDLKSFLTNQGLSPSNRAEEEGIRLSRWLLCSYGLTVKMQVGLGSYTYLRSAPSAGGLYPAEVYLISRGTEFLPVGLYHYEPQTHSLKRFWDSDVWMNLQIACFHHPALTSTHLAVVTSAIFIRSTWRYEDRAYRRICLDTGHLLGNLELAGAINGFRPHLVGGFRDQSMNDLFYFDSSQESVLTVMALADLTEAQQQFISTPQHLASSIETDYPLLPDGELLSYFHQKTCIDQPISLSYSSPNSEDKYNFPFCLKISSKSLAINWEEELTGLETTLLNRRSTREYSSAEITLEELKAVLHFTYHPEDYRSQGLDPNPDYFDLNLLQTFIAVSNVQGLEEGCYYYAPKAQELRQIRFKNFRRELHYLCLGQELGRDAGAIIFHTADLKKAVQTYGDRSYRYLHLDAGHLGQRLNLGAIHLGLGVSGIGGFFDDQVNEVLGIPNDEAVIYVTTLGRPKNR